MNINKELSALSKLLEKQDRMARVDGELQEIDSQLDAELLRLRREENEYSSG